MASGPRILAFAGSTRRDSFNKRLLALAVRGAQAAGAAVTSLDLREVPMPLYDGDLEAAQGLPEAAKTFKNLLLQHDGLLIAAPEYNSGISGVLKNAIDWASRPAPGEAPLKCFAGKVAALMSASPGALGGLRGLAQVRWILGNIKVLVLPEQVAIPRAHEAFLPDGGLNDRQQQLAVEQLGRELTRVLTRLQDRPPGGTAAPAP